MNNNVDIDKVVAKLPDYIYKYWKETTASVGCDPILTFNGLLGMISISIGTSARAEPKPFYYIYVGLYICVVGTPSTRKTPSLRQMLSPLNHIQKENSVMFDEAYAEYLESKKNKDTDDKVLSKPRFISSFLTDTTIESLAEELRNNKLGILVRKDELSNFFQSLNKYHGGTGDLQTILELYDNTQISISRKSLDKPILIENPFLSIIGGMQPVMLKQIFTSGDVGLIERFIFGLADINYYKGKPRVNRNEVSADVMKLYSDSFVELYRKSEDILKKGLNQTYKLSIDAYQKWEEWQNNKQIDEEYESMFQKASARAIKFALMFEIINFPERKKLEISLESMELAIETSEIFIQNHIDVLNHLQDGDVAERMNKMLSYLKKQFRNPNILRHVEGYLAIEIRRIYSNKAGGTKGDKEATYDILELLAQKGYGMMLPRNPKSDSPKSFYFLPKFYE